LKLINRSAPLRAVCGSFFTIIASEILAESMGVDLIWPFQRPLALQARDQHINQIVLEPEILVGDKGDQV